MAKRATASSVVNPSLWTRETLPRVVLVAGAESALREEALTAIRTVAFGPKGQSDGWVVLHGPQNLNEAEALTPATVLDEVCTRSMFAADDDPKIVVVRSADILLSSHYRLFDDNLETIPTSATLVFECASFGKLKTTGFYKKLLAFPAVVECNPLVGEWGDSPALEQEVDKRARALGLKLAHGALLALVGRSAKNLGVIEEELNKLALAFKPIKAAAEAEGKTASAMVDVSEHDILELCSATGTASAFDFATALLDGNARGALETLGLLFDRGIVDAKKPGKPITQEGAIVMVVLGALTYKLTQLQDVREAIDGGKSEFTAFGEFKLFGKRADEMRMALRRQTSASLRNAVEALFTCYLDLRRGGAEPRAVMERLVFKTLGREA
ncbi:MAG: hypothetical protein WCT04_04370 [Planctomycetota bacterium]